MRTTKTIDGSEDGRVLPGRLIAVEGVDGSGKSTQIALLYKWLRGQGRKVFFSEWNSSDLVRGATKRGKKNQLLTPTTFSLIHATDFADRYERQILPMLRAGFIVLCDRYVYTSYARDEGRGCAPDWLRQIYGFAHQPDITFFFHVPVDVALDRLVKARSQPSYFESGMDLGLDDDPHQSFLIFQGRITANYLRMVEEFGLVRVDAMRQIIEQQEFLRGYVTERIDLEQFEVRTEYVAQDAYGAIPPEIPERQKKGKRR
jgi:dTMP kinase